VGNDKNSNTKVRNIQTGLRKVFNKYKEIEVSMMRRVKKISKKALKAILLSLLLVQLCFATELKVAESSALEPLYLSLCGLLIISIGLISGPTRKDPFR
jgi:hypothetical protein